MSKAINRYDGASEIITRLGGVHIQSKIVHGNYEIIDSKVSLIPQSNIDFKLRNGRATLKYTIQELGITISKNELTETYEDFLKLADGKKEISDHEILECIRIKKLKIKCGL